MSEQEKICYEQGKCEALEAKLAEANTQLIERTTKLKEVTAVLAKVARERDENKCKVSALEKQLDEERMAHKELIKKASKKPKKPIRVPGLGFAASAVFCVLLIVLVNSQLLSPIVGEPALVLGLCMCFGFAGVLIGRIGK